MIKILNIKEQKDGSCILDIECTSEIKSFILKYYNRKKFTNKLLEKFIIDGLKNTIK